MSMKIRILHHGETQTRNKQCKADSRYQRAGRCGEYSDAREEATGVGKKCNNEDIYN